MKLIKAADLAAEWGLTEAELLRRRRRYGWPCVKLTRTDVRFTELQVEQIIASRSVAASPPPANPTGQTSRSKART